MVTQNFIFILEHEYSALSKSLNLQANSYFASLVNVELINNLSMMPNQTYIGILMSSSLTPANPITYVYTFNVHTGIVCTCALAVKSPEGNT